MARKNSDAFDPPDEDPYENRRRPRKILKTAAMAVFLFVLGSLMLYFGVQILSTERDRALGMIVVGSLAFLPGSYATWNLYGAFREWPGYSFDAVPSYDD